MTYKVKKGDTLTSIAKKHGTTVNILLKLNPNIKNANQIKVGWVVTLPSPDLGKVLKSVLSDIEKLDSFKQLEKLMG